MTNNTTNQAPFVLLILDGWGHREEIEYNAIALSDTPVWDKIWNAPGRRRLLDCSGEAVGLPPGQMGSSEVGHMNLGAGRVVYQDYSLISRAQKDGAFATNSELCIAMQCAKAGQTLHLFGLFSPGGVHSHESHIFAMIDAAVANGVKQIRLHAFLDGRDTPPKSAATSMKRFEERTKSWHESGACVYIASICGRFYAMDRDQRFERTKAAYNLLTQGICDRTAKTPQAGLDAAYAAGETDEFVRPTVIQHNGAPASVVSDGDAVIFMNFRSDRARQLSRAFRETNFQGFQTQVAPNLGAFVTLTHYLDGLDAEVAFKSERLANTMGEYLSKVGKTQLRVAETEKFAHVTFFFSGGMEQAYEGEEWILVPSPADVATYDLKPEMSAYAVADVVVDSVANARHDVVVCNFANTDMVGHTGNFEAAKQAVATVDRCLGRILAAVQDAGGQCLITADHGNVETMQDTEHNQPHTAHTLSQVPLVYAAGNVNVSWSEGVGKLADVAPTMLELMGLSKPDEMTGESFQG